MFVGRGEVPLLSRDTDTFSTAPAGAERPHPHLPSALLPQVWWWRDEWGLGEAAGVERKFPWPRKPFHVLLPGSLLRPWLHHDPREPWLSSGDAPAPPASLYSFSLSLRLGV